MSRHLSRRRRGKPQAPRAHNPSDVTMTTMMIVQSPTKQAGRRERERELSRSTNSTATTTAAVYYGCFVCTSCTSRTITITQEKCVFTLFNQCCTAHEGIEVVVAVVATVYINIRKALPLPKQLRAGLVYSLLIAR